MLVRPNRPATGGGPAGDSASTMPGGMPSGGAPAGLPAFGTMGIGGQDAGGAEAPGLGGLNKPQDNRQKSSLAGIPQLDKSM